jgi:hypothetical protein
VSYTVERIKCLECKLNTADFEVEIWRFEGDVSFDPFCPNCGSTNVLKILNRMVFVFYSDTLDKFAIGPDQDDLWTETGFGLEKVVEAPGDWEQVEQL